VIGSRCTSKPRLRMRCSDAVGSSCMGSGKKPCCSSPNDEHGGTYQVFCVFPQDDLSLTSSHIFSLSPATDRQSFSSGSRAAIFSAN
jgi:hypothetical protein